MNNTLWIGILAGVMLTGCLLTSAAAQTGPGMMLAPWAEESRMELRGSVGVLGESDTEGGNDVDLTWIESEGRARLNPADGDHDLTFGFNQFALEIDEAGNQLPPRASVQRFSLGGRLGAADGWDIYATGGAGFASDSPFDDGQGWFGTGSVTGVHEINPKEKWIVSLSFDGNRAIFPDVPLPAVAYQVRESDRLVYTLGLPVSRLFWRPHDAVWLNVDYFLPVTFNARINYAMHEQLHLFGALNNRFVRFHQDDGGSTDHQFFEQRRVEAGVNWRVDDHIDLIAAGGFAFDQEFSTGWDVRDTENEVEIDDAVFFRLGVDLTF